jgi:hypothetical protein
MIISHKYKVIFIHIYKNAGTFITAFLHNLDPNLDTQFLGHVTSKEGKALLNPNIWNSYAKFCVVRNSYDYIVSLYNYTKYIYNTSYTNHPTYNLVKDMSFYKFLSFKDPKSTANQIDFIMDDDNKLMVDNVIKFENLIDELIDFFHNVVKVDIICIQEALPTNKINVSPKEYNIHYTDYYDDTSKLLVNEIYTKDIDYFKFEFLPVKTIT